MTADEGQIKQWRLESFLLYGILFLIVLGAVYAGGRQVSFNRHTIDQFCTVATRQRHALEQQAQTTHDYLRSPAGREHTGLNDYIRKFSVPQIRLRLKTEKTPPACRNH